MTDIEKMRKELLRLQAIEEMKTGGPAFPVPDNGWLYSGMSLRDWFAGQALAGMCAAPAMEGETWKDFATRAYLAADTMLLVREQTDD